MNRIMDAAVDISICLCTFNRADQLKDALDSLFAQHTDGVFTFEIVIVDDGSTDTTPVVVNQATAISPVPIRYVRQPNSGVATARNRSVKEANGEWLAFFDDDQIACAQWLLRLFRRAEQTGAECIGGPSLLTFPAGGEINPIGTVRKLLGENPFMMRAPTYLSWLDLRRKTTAIPGTGNALVRKKIFSRLGGFREGVRYGEDFEFFHKIAQTGIRMDIAPEAIIYQVVPVARLQPAYLLPLAKKGALNQADHDWKYFSRARIFLLVILRSGFLAFWIAPTLVAAYWSNRPEVLLAKRCSLSFSITYLRRIADNIRSKKSDGE